MMLKNLNIFFLRKHGLGLLLTLSWAIQAYPILTTNPHFEEVVTELVKIHEDARKESDQTDRVLPQSVSTEASQNAVMEFKRQWLLSIMFISVGLASAICSHFQVRYWRSAVILTSMMYLGVWYSSGSLSMVPPIDAMQLKWSIAKVFHHEVSFFIKDVVLPIFYIWVIGYLTYGSFVIYKSKK